MCVKVQFVPIPSPKVESLFLTHIIEQGNFFLKFGVDNLKWKLRNVKEPQVSSQVLKKVITA